MILIIIILIIVVFMAIFDGGSSTNGNRKDDDIVDDMIMYNMYEDMMEDKDIENIEEIDDFEENYGDEEMFF